MCTEECNATPRIVQFFTDTDVHCSAADNWKTPQWKTSAWNIGAHCKTILQMMAAPLPLVPIIRRHLRSMNNTKNAGANRNCRATIFDATPHAVYLSVRPVLRIFLQKEKNERQTKSKTWKSAFLRGRAKVTLFEWTGDQHELPTRGGIRSALRSTWRCESKHKQPSG